METCFVGEAAEKEKGTLALRNVAGIDGVFPRDFELMPDEKHVIVGHKRSNEVCMYRFDSKSFNLEPVGSRIQLWNPLCFAFSTPASAK